LYVEGSLKSGGIVPDGTRLILVISFSMSHRSLNL